MRTQGVLVLTLGLVALTTVPGCKRKEPEPIPGPKAAAAMIAAGHLAPATARAIEHTRAAGIAWFQGSLDEAFAKPQSRGTCDSRQTPMAAPLAPLPPVPPESPRARSRLIPSSPAACRVQPCPAIAYPRRPLV